MRYWQFVVLLLWLSAGISAAQSSQTASAASGEWEFDLTPFLWGAGLDGTIGIARREVTFEATAKDIMKSLDMGFMVDFEARRNRWSFETDLVYVDLGKDVTVEGIGGIVGGQNPQLDMRLTLIDGTIGYQLAPSFDVLAGVRGVVVSPSISNDLVTIADADDGFVDPIIGGRFRRDVSKKVWVNLRGDVGGFGVGSEFSWFLSAAAGIRVSHLISLDFGYRAWSFDYESDSDLKRLDATMAGFGGGLTFHF